MSRMDVVTIEDIGLAVHAKGSPYMTVSGFVVGGPKSVVLSGRTGPRRAMLRLTRTEAARLGRELAHLTADDSRWPDEYGYLPDRP